MSFLSAGDQAARFPETFQLPDTSNVVKGSFVKVCWVDERFWVQVTHVQEGGNAMTGVVANHLVRAPFAMYEEVRFVRDNIYEV